MKLSDYMDQTDLTEAKIAVLVGCSQATVNKIKLGKQWPGPDLLRRIAAVTDGKVTPNDFAGIPSEKDEDAQ